MGKIISNGINYNGLINAQGVFIDINNLIYSNVTSLTSESYIATEDCYIMQDVVCGSGQVSTVKIDNITVAEYFYQPSSVFLIPYTIFLKKGQVLSVEHGTTATHTVNVYGIQQGSIQNVLPDVTSADAGKVLTVNSSGIWTPSQDATITVYHGTPNLTYVQSDQGTEATLTKIEYSNYIMYQFKLNMHIANSGIISQQYIPLYTFDAGVLDDLDWNIYLLYTVPSGSNYVFGRIKFSSSNPGTGFNANTIGAYWSDFTGNAWYGNTPMVYIVPKN